MNKIDTTKNPYSLSIVTNSNNIFLIPIFFELTIKNVMRQQSGKISFSGNLSVPYGKIKDKGDLIGELNALLSPRDFGIELQKI